METKNKIKMNKWKITTVSLIVVLVAVSFFVLFKPQTGVAANPNFLDVTVSGPTKLGVNEAGTYTAMVSNSFSDSLDYVWSISPEDNKTVIVPNGDSCTLIFTVATEEPYILTVQVKDNVVGNMGSAVLAVHDPYTSPTLYLGAYGAPYSYLIQTDGLGWYRAINGQTGAVAYTSTSAKTVFESAQTAMTTGGIIRWSGNINLGTTGLVFTVTGAKGLIFQGDGQKSSILTYTGTGNALTIQTNGTLSYETFTLKDFAINCVSKTAGRNGIYLNQVARVGTLENLDIQNAAFGVVFYGCNDIISDNVRVSNTNIGFETRSGPVEDCNDLTFRDCTVLSSTVYAYNFTAGHSNAIEDGSIAPTSGVGVYTEGSYGMMLDSVHFDALGAGEAFIKISGTSGAFPTIGMSIDACTFYGQSLMDYAISIEYGVNININSPTFRGHTNASIYLFNNSPQNVLVNQPNDDGLNPDPAMFDSPTMTVLSTKLAGTVIQGNTIGNIVVGAAAYRVGDVIFDTYKGNYGTFGQAANDKRPAAVMLASLGANKPVVIATSGFANVNCTGHSIAVGDILVSAGDGFAMANNTQTDASRILGYAVGDVGSNIWYMRVA